MLQREADMPERERSVGGVGGGGHGKKHVQETPEQSYVLLLSLLYCPCTKSAVPLCYMKFLHRIFNILFVEGMKMSGVL